MAKCKSENVRRRDRDIRKQYEELLRVKIKPGEAKKIIAEKFYISYATVENVIYRRN